MPVQQLEARARHAVISRTGCKNKSTTAQSSLLSGSKDTLRSLPNRSALNAPSTEPPRLVQRCANREAPMPRCVNGCACLGLQPASKHLPAWGHGLADTHCTRLHCKPSSSLHTNLRVSQGATENEAQYTHTHTHTVWAELGAKLSIDSIAVKLDQPMLANWHGPRACKA